ncbi:MAG: alpha/beta hydrolase [Mariprofundaceae bacterium]
MPARWPCLAGAALLLLLLLAGCAAPRLQPAQPETIRPLFVDNSALMADGYVLPLSSWEPKGAPRAVVLGLHGFNDYRQAFAGVGPFLAERGIITYAYDQRGFGETADIGLWAGAARMAKDAKAMIHLLRKRHGETPLFVLGESMGGAVMMAAIADAHPPDIDGVVLLAPAVWGRTTMPWYQRLALWIGVHTFPATTATGKGLDITPSDNIDMLRALGSDPLVIKETRIDTIYGLANLMDEALLAARWQTAPALIAYGQRDEIIPKQPTCEMLRALPNAPSRQSRLVIYPEGYHMLTRDLQAEAVLDDIAAWIMDQKAPLPSANEKNFTDLGEACETLWK